MAEHGVVIDALPYSDQGYEDDRVREAAAKLIEEEVTMKEDPTPLRNHARFLD